MKKIMYRLSALVLALIVVVLGLSTSACRPRKLPHSRQSWAQQETNIKHGRSMNAFAIKKRRLSILNPCVRRRLNEFVCAAYRTQTKLPQAAI